MKRKSNSGKRLAQNCAKKYRPFISRELSQTELRYRRGITKVLAAGPDIKISSRDLDSAFEPAQSQGTYGRGGVDGIAYERGTSAGAPAGDDDNNRDAAHPISAIAQAYQSMGEDGCTIQVIRHSQPRKKVPEWILTALGEFIRSRLTAQQRVARYVPLSEQINFNILHDYYLEKYADKAIYQRYRRLLKRDRAGSRWTCSATAVKARRERLVKEGNAWSIESKTSEMTKLKVISLPMLPYVKRIPPSLNSQVQIPLETAEDF
jgi:hypothetical protein